MQPQWDIWNHVRFIPETPAGWAACGVFAIVFVMLLIQYRRDTR